MSAVKAIKDNDLSINVSIGSSSTKSVTVTTETSAQGSTLTAGENLTLTATGSGATDTTGTATDGDLTVAGSSLSGENIDLTAANDINLVSADNTAVSTTTYSSSSVGVGVKLKNGSTPSYFVQASTASDDATESITTHTETTVDASSTLTISSGSDTNLTGAQATGDTVNVSVGGNLNITSQQDTDNYTENSSSVGVTVSTTGITGSASKGDTDSTYASVTDQSGIYAGTGGFDITVSGNTDLMWAVIASTADSTQNTLTTGTLTYSDIENTAKYSSSSVGVSVNTTSSAEYNEKGITPNIGVTATGDDSSTTKSAVAAGTIEVKSGNADLSSLSRDTDSAVNALGKIFDKKTVQEQQQLAALFGEVAYEQIHKISEKNGWTDSSSEKIALHALVGGIMADLGGGSIVSGATGAAVNEALQGELRNSSKIILTCGSGLVLL